MPEIVSELDALLGRMQDVSVATSHVDSHGHLHKFKPFLLRRLEGGFAPDMAFVVCAEFRMSICADPCLAPLIGWACTAKSISAALITTDFQEFPTHNEEFQMLLLLQGG
jgi:hypothetical protein